MAFIDNTSSGPAVENSEPTMTTVEVDDSLSTKLASFRRLRSAGDEAAAAREERLLFIELRPVAWHVARRFRHVSLGEEDIRQEAFVGLIEAMRNYPETVGTKPVSFLSTVIERRLIHFVNAHSRIVRRPDSWFRRMARVRAVEAEMESRGETVSDVAVAGRLGIATELVRNWKTLGRTEVSLAAPVGDGSESEASRTLLDTVADDSLEHPSAAMESAEGIDQVRGALTGLPVRDRQVLELRFGASEGRSLEEIGNKLGVSRERVRQLEERGLKKMRELLSAPDAA